MNKTKIIKAISIYLLINIVGSIFLPTVAFALTSGPSQPEFSSFEPVATTNMVNPFSGDFTYNLPVIEVPGPNGSSYPLSLSYHSGASIEEEASWVGYGWSLNPGAINRGKKGNPDDFNGTQNTTIFNKNPANITATANASLNFEAFSSDVNLTVAPTISYNNNKGFGTALSIGLGVYQGLAGMNYTVSDGEGSFSFDVNPLALVTRSMKKKIKENDKTIKVIQESRCTKKEELQGPLRLENKRMAKTAKKALAYGKISGGMISAFGMHLMSDNLTPMSVAEYTGGAFNISFKFGPTPLCLDLTPELGVGGSISWNVTPETSSFPAYGYLYNHSATFETGGNNRNLMDYSVEKESMYSKRDKTLPIPHSAPDNFSVSGEGLAGGFRLYSKKVGHYFAPSKNNSTKSGNYMIDLETGLDNGGGAQVGYSYHYNSVNEINQNSWVSYGSGNVFKTYDFSKSIPSDEAYFMRYNGDLGGNVIYSENDNASAASFGVSLNIPGTKVCHPIVPSDIYSVMEGDRSGRSSYISYTLNKEIDVAIDNIKANANDKRDYSGFLDRSNGQLKDGIGEVASYSNDGRKYVYGLPVYAKEETNLSKSVFSNSFFDALGNSKTTLDGSNQFLIYKNNESKYSRSVVGQHSPSPYATTYLLTQITTPDYIDRQNNGISDDDFGGWTQFSYEKYYGFKKVNETTGATDNFYKWRTPYTGMYYDRGELSDPTDDMATFQSGEKEIYYLKKIETKTHVAYFITNNMDPISVTNTATGNVDVLQGSGTLRVDALGAAAENIADRDRTAKNTSMRLQRLEKIILYAKDPTDPTKVNGKPLKVVNLDYYTSAEALCKNVPNSDDLGALGGKLSLKKIWFEYEGITNSKIAPYEFKYEYKKDFQVNGPVINKYPEIVNYGKDFNENPDYSPDAIDGWGNYAYDGVNRKSLMKSWVYQGIKQIDANNKYFDPAAWQLKRIILPTGGEILVQYEQHDYQYVQNEFAMAMVKIKAQLSETEYKLDVSELGITKATDIALLNTKINDYLKINKKIHFQFLYALIGSAGSLYDCNMQNFSGYVNAVSSVDGDGDIRISLNQSGYALPQKVCQDYYKKNKSGLVINSNCNQNPDGITGNLALDLIAIDLDIAKNIVKTLVNKYRPESTTCQKISVENSYFRIPVLDNKLGGGIRVKRIMMYDAGIESGDEMLYGSEYVYKNTDGKSSGVATNEPIRQENALVKFMDKRAPQSFLNKITSGEDKEQFEEPLGESLLPPPSIGYSRVVVNNIHTGKSTSGFTVYEYYTCKEYPLSFSNGVSVTGMDEESDWMLIPAIWVNYSVDNRWCAQGYRFAINDMHGKQKRVATYGGYYGPAKDQNQNSLPGYGLDEKKYVISSEEIHEYFKPGELVPVLNEDGTITNQSIGKEQDITMELRSVEDVSQNGSIQIDFEVGIALAIPIPNASLMPYYSYSERKLRTHVTNKVVRYSCIPKKVISMRDNIISITENKAFNKFTGDPIVTSVTDTYDGLVLKENGTTAQKGAITNFDYPASYVYKQMGAKYINDKRIVPISATLGIDNSFTIAAVDFPLNYIVEGDLVGLNVSTDVGLFYVQSISQDQDPTKLKVQLQPLTSNVSSNGTITSSSVGSGDFTYLKVFNSGYTNTLSLSAGKVSLYGDNYTATSLPRMFTNRVQNSFNNVISASATVYSDIWSDADVNSDYSVAGNDFEKGNRGKWRMQSTYTFKSPTKDAYSTTTAGINNRVYTNAGIYSSFTGFNYSASIQAGGWIKVSEVKKYSPHGNALEEENAIGTKSTAKFGYKESVPILIAQNGAYTSVWFNSFEDKLSETNISNYSHSGSKSKLLEPSNKYKSGLSTQPTGILKVDAQVKSKGLIAKLWVRMGNEAINAEEAVTASISKTDNTIVGNSVVNKIARVGEWTLLEVQFPATLFSDLPLATSISFDITNSSTTNIFVDDIRVQPLDCQMNTYVYNSNNLKLLATFDDQNFAMFYQYNAEGKLVRKLVETEKGIKTISETQYNVPLK